jgi:glucan 1,6-alpha-isomaltosidase
MPSRRDVLKAAGFTAAGGTAWASLASTPAGASAPTRTPGSRFGPVDTTTAPETSDPAILFRPGGPGPLYWSTYGYSNATNSQIPEAVWQANIDWIAQDLAPYGYRMVCTDGWIDGDQDVTANGYIQSLADDWEHDWAWWAQYLQDRGMQLGVYYNPLWVTKSAASDRNIRVAGRPDVAVGDIVDPHDWFDGGGELQWVDATKDGAEEYVKGYVEYFRSLGVTFLRIDFLGWYEIGYDQAGYTPGRAHGRESYVQALQWMHDAAGGQMLLSLVMPNMFDHGAAERLYGDLARIDNDLSFGTWNSLSGGRQTWQPIWSQWNNPFLGFTGFSDISGPGQLILDGDPLNIGSFSSDGERQTAISLFTMAGAPIAIADQYDTIGDDTSFYTNEEVLEVRQAGLVGKPISYNPHSYDYDPRSRDPERWVGQLPDGSWVVGLFNRTTGPAPSERNVRFHDVFGLNEPALVRDLWAHQDVGTLTSWKVTLQPHLCSLVKVTPQEPVRYLAEVGGLGGTARFDNTFAGHIGLGYVTGLDTPGSSVTLRIAVDSGGEHQLSFRVVNATGNPASLTVVVQDPQTGVVSGIGRLNVRNSAGWTDWRRVEVPLAFEAGTNFVVVSFESDDSGSIHLDSVTVDS